MILPLLLSVTHREEDILISNKFYCFCLMRAVCRKDVLEASKMCDDRSICF